jgi:hypothetical protein
MQRSLYLVSSIDPKLAQFIESNLNVVVVNEQFLAQEGQLYQQRIRQSRQTNTIYLEKRLAVTVPSSRNG